MIKHIVMWKVKGDSQEEKRANVERVRQGLRKLEGAIPGMTYIEIGVNESRVEYACDVVLYSEFESQKALDAYGIHPVHFQVRDELQGMRITRHQVDYTVGQDERAG
jgi:hypothetical protein